MTRTGIALALALAAFAPAASAQEAVDSGALRATVEADPWRISFQDARGVVLAEVAQSAAGPSGKLGFRSGGTWYHATRVLESRRDGAAYVATLATDDPGGRTIAVRVEPAGDGIVALDATTPGDRAGIAFEAAAGEHYLGFGQRSNAVDQRGRDVQSFVADGPWQPIERPFINAFIPPYANPDRDDATNFPIPWLLSTRGYGVLVDNNETSWHRLADERPDAWSVETESGRLRLRVFAGPAPADVLRRFSAAVGRQPPAAAPFFFGPWFQPREGDKRSIDVLRQADAPASVANTYTHYLPCGDQRGAEQAQRDRTALFHSAGLAVTTYFNPMICTDYQPVFDEARRRGVLTKNQSGQPYEYRYAVTNQFEVGQVDFSAPGAQEFYSALLQEAIDHGYDGWMEDFGEYTPPDSVSADGTPGPAMHNLYPTLYHRAAYEFSRRAPRPLARFNRSGWTGAAASSQIVWGGDPSTDWGFDGLESALWQGLTMGLSGVSLWGTDIGGFDTISSPVLTPELLIRWIQLGAFTGVMRTEANGVTVPPRSTRRPQIYDAEILPVWRRYAKLRTQLYPYIAAAEAEYDRSGMPIMRHHALTHPGDPEAVARDGQFMFGPDLLAAPVVRPGQSEQKIQLPPGAWIDFWEALSYRDGDGALVPTGRATLVEGGREVTLAAPLERIPLAIRAGALIPLLPADVDTLADYGDAPEIVNLRERGARRLVAFPRGRTRARVAREASVLSREARGRRWLLTIRGDRRRAWLVEASLATLRRPFRPCRVLADGRPLPRSRWRYDRAAARLDVRLRARSVRIDVRGC